jgi:hypothetical protein
VTGGPGARPHPHPHPHSLVRTLTAALVTVGCLLIAAHFLRADMRVVALCCAAAPGLLFVRRPWAPRIVQLMLFAATVEWLRTAIALVHGRVAAGEPWRRMAAILAAVAGITLWAALVAPRACRGGSPRTAGR